jgi:hypothetical protein
MKPSYSRKTRPWPARTDCGRPRSASGYPRGAVSLVVIFLLFVFSGLGLSMIFLSQMHIRINAWRKFSVFLDYASENGLKRGLRDLGGWLQARGRCAPVSGAAIEALRQSPGAGFRLLLEEALGGGFPRLLQESENGLSWESLSTCDLHNAADCGTYFRIAAALRVESKGGMMSLRPRRASSLEGSLGILAGRLPLAAVPLLINADMSVADRVRFAADNGISFPARRGEVLPPEPVITPEEVLPDDASALIGKALKTRFFAPQDLTDIKLREALGLPLLDEPVPEGVYLMANDLGLGGVFVRGDIKEMVTAIDGDEQVIVFRMEAGEWRLAFSPARSRTVFLTPAGSFSYDLAPLGIIIVDGKIGSLGGGEVGLDGTIEMVTDTEVPSILSGINLTIVSSDEIRLTSHLILQGVKWQDGIPYIRDSQSQVVIYAAGHDFQTGAGREAGIVVDAGGPDGLKVQASLTAGNGEFEIEGTGKTVELMGALHAKGYAGNGNALRIASDERVAAGRFPEDSPLTSSPQFSVYSLRILSWREY